MLSTPPNHQILGGKERRKEENEQEESNGMGRLPSNNIIVSISPFEQFLLVLFGSKNCTCCIQGLQHGWAQKQGRCWQQPSCREPQGRLLPACPLTAAWSQLYPPAAGLPSPGTAAGPAGWGGERKLGPSSCLSCCLCSLSPLVPAPFASEERNSFVTLSLLLNLPSLASVSLPLSFSLPTSSLYATFSGSSVFWKGKLSPPSTRISCQNWLSFPPAFSHLISILYIF